MTKGTNQVVSLSPRDWCGIIGCVLTVILALVGGYLRHDRSLSQLDVHIQAQAQRIEAVEKAVENIEERLWLGRSTQP